MRTRAYLCGVEQVNGYDAWSLFKASAANEVTTVETLLAKDRRLANAPFWYQLPIHFAVGAGNHGIVKLLLAHGAAG